MPTPEPRTVDFRRHYWGHALELREIPRKPWQRARRLSGHLWTLPRPCVGDQLLWTAAHGEVVAEVERVEHMADPDDMAFVTVKVIWRSATGGPRPQGVPA